MFGKWLKSCYFSILEVAKTTSAAVTKVRKSHTIMTLVGVAYVPRYTVGLIGKKRSVSYSAGLAVRCYPEWDNMGHHILWYSTYTAVGRVL
jgi:hypothetical protein